MNLNAKYLFFDLDDTLTPNKTIMEDDMYELLSSLPHTKVIVSGANIPQIVHQTRGLPFYKMAQNGNHAVNIENEVIWKESLDDSEIIAVQNHVNAVKDYVSSFIEVTENNPVIHGGQISFSLMNQDTDRKIKEAFDPNKTFRREILKKIPCSEDSIQVTVAGATSFDYLPKGKHKGYYVKKFIDYMGWDKNECLYFGDSFYPGGNDEPVTGIIETVPVENHRETYQHLLKFTQVV